MITRHIPNSIFNSTDSIVLDSSYEAKKIIHTFKEKYTTNTSLQYYLTIPLV